VIGRYALSLLAFMGLALAVGAVIQGNRTAPVAPPVVRLPEVPFTSYVAGAGLVQASTENIAIGTPVSGIVTAIYVKWGDRVNAGDPLIKIDDRDLQGHLLVALAKVKEAESNLAKIKNLLKVAEGLRTGSSITTLDMANRRFDVAINEAVLQSADGDAFGRVRAKRRP
jgi:multidrug efflux pump subunit AcrA (membrane-fusion protein)